MAADAVRFETFTSLSPISDLRPESQRDLFSKISTRRAKSGSYLFRVGDTTAESLYVIDGEVALENAEGKTVSRVIAGSEAAGGRLAHQFPRSLSARCLGPVTVIAMDNGLLDVLLTWDQTGSYEVSDWTSESGNDDAGDWMTRILRLPAFQMVPPGNLQTLFMRLEPQTVSAGDVIVTQGEPGDYFYVIDTGHCLVTRESPTHDKPIKLAELTDGGCFGEEALIADTPRNATVTMVTDGTLLRLAKEDFRDLLHGSSARHVDATAAQRLIKDDGARLLDVRLPSEFRTGHVEGAQNLPLYLLRMKLAGMPRDVPYILCCDTGRRSSVAAFIMTQKGFDAQVLQAAATREAATG